jgi:hypothetical protein
MVTGHNSSQAIQVIWEGRISNIVFI